MLKIAQLVLLLSAIWIPVYSSGGLLNSVQRKLDWIFATNNVKGNIWYYDNTESSFAAGLKKPSLDVADSLWDNDICPGADGSFERNNCASPPNCDEEISELQFGYPKLCINRAPLPWDKNVYYVVAMKCIPFWDTCDSCICGTRTPDLCVYSGDEKDFPKDSNIEINCADPINIKLRGEEFYPGNSPVSGAASGTSPPSLPTPLPPTSSPVSSPPTQVPVTSPPTPVPVTSPPTPVPVTSPPTPVPSSPPVLSVSTQYSTTEEQLINSIFSNCIICDDPDEYEGDCCEF